MVEIVRVNIEFNPQGEKLLVIPEKITATQYSVIQWNIICIDKEFLKFIDRRDLIFTLYFSKESPFFWKRQFIQTHGDYPFFLGVRSKVLRLAEDVAEKKGDYKYGVSISEAENNDTLYDEDPYISIV